MTNNNIVLVVIIGLVVAAIGGGMYWAMQSQNGIDMQNSNISDPNTQAGLQNKGKVVFSITDAAADMQQISSIQMTINKIEMHSATQGWITVSSQPKTYDLLQLKQSGTFQIYADATVAADTYNQIRLQADNIIVVHSQTAKQAKLPSGELKINGNIKVENNATTSVVLDFLADKSLHMTGKGEFIFTPVVNMESRSNTDAQVTPSGSVMVNGGNVDTKITTGMDLGGDMKSNFILDTKSDLEITNGIIQLKGTSTIDANGNLQIGL